MSALKTKSQKITYSTPYFRINEVEFERNGKAFKKNIIERKPFAVVLPLTSNNELYLINQFRDAIGRICLEAIAGFMEPEEDPQEIAKRELKEETGLKARKWRRIATFNLANNMRSRGFVFLAQGLERGAQELDEDEDITVVRMPLQQAVEKVLTGEIDVATYAAAILLLDKLVREGKV